uniref:Proteasome alpha-type subunits domain-containing protein n=2 Tax=Rhizochromulina marina TaxID=1034831 RepID=A0A7S2SP97_9STRA|eukprot:CAMPEP_0118969262 /NCGR_PEP_ID=MMETSP1173-20130426/6374_1 /TAXON_ID=1034831 /ORGANISM="Rhizochromulina marina cf, Strain CCMP1243" /LENGTH=237 /DNA_ID=CAMNT_0006918479 /DNA_START=65 /DNA_END=778 /DNA_ORIENTATION=+
MAGSEANYSFSLTTFSRTGKLFQIEYALNAIQGGKLALGIRAKNGVVICTDKKVPTSLIDSAEVHKVEEITPSCGMVYAGLGPDYRVLVKNARKTAQKYYTTYHEVQPVPMLVKDTALVCQEYTQSGGVRPFGVSLLVAGFDDEGPHLFQVDPSGTYFAWKATAIGKNFKNARSFLERRYRDDIEIDDAIHTALLTMREGFEGEMNEHNIELAVIGADRKFRILSPAEVRDYLDEAV